MIVLETLSEGDPDVDAVSLCDLDNDPLVLLGDSVNDGEPIVFETDPLSVGVDVGDGVGGGVMVSVAVVLPEGVTDVESDTVTEAEGLAVSEAELVADSE